MKHAGAIEFLSRMAGRSNFRTPKTIGSATNEVAITALDIAHAVATTPDKLGAAMAMAMACGRPSEWKNVERLGHARIVSHLRGQLSHRGVVDPPYTYRARVAMYDAFHDLVAPARRRNLRAAARDARMPKKLYQWLLHEVCAELEAAANTAAADAMRFLFATYIDAARDEGTALEATFDHEGNVELAVIKQTPCEIDQLCRDVLRRPRRAGVLTLMR